MKMLINNSILNKFKDTISEKDYKNGWEKLQAYQEQSALIRNYKETEFQSEFLAKIFGDILGYIPRSKSIKEANLIVEKKIEDGQKFIDGAIIDKEGKSKIVIELKDTKSANLLKSKGGKGGLHSLAPMQQASIYLFSESQADLAVVSNFDSLIIFDRKEKFRQEFSLFDMDYETFQEFYLILCSNSYWGGLTSMMIKQSGEQEKLIDDEFFTKVKSLHSLLHNTMSKENADDLFNKFMTLAILEDNGVLPTNLINSIHNKKDDFTHKMNHWALWSEFFKAMKAHKQGRELMGINPAVAQMEVWQDVSYLGRTKLPKSTLDLVVEISKYDLFSVPLQELFFYMAVEIDSPYDLVLTDVDKFEFYSELLQKDDGIGCDQATSFITMKAFNTDKPLIKLFNQVSPTPIVQDQNGINFAIAPQLDIDDCWILRDLWHLEDEETVNLIKQKGLSIQLYETELDPDYSYVLINLTFFGFGKDAAGDLPLMVNYGKDTGEIDRKTIKNKIMLLSTEDQKWLDERIVNSTPLSEFVEIVDEKDADLRFELYSKALTKYDTESERWETETFEFLETTYLYLKGKNSDVSYILNSDEFHKTLELISTDETNFLDLPIFEEQLSEEWLNKARGFAEINEKIRLYEAKQERLEKKGAPELEILKVEEMLDRLYEEQSEYEF